MRRITNICRDSQMKIPDIRHFRICLYCPEDANILKVASALNSGFKPCKKHKQISKKPRKKYDSSKRLEKSRNNDMEMRTIERNGKPLKQYLRVCEKCDGREWKKYNVSQLSTICAKCCTIKCSRNNAPASSDEMEQDEVKNALMIEEWLKSNQVTVIGNR